MQISTIYKTIFVQFKMRDVRICSATGISDGRIVPHFRGVENIIKTLATEGSSETQANFPGRNILHRVFTKTSAKYCLYPNKRKLRGLSPLANYSDRANTSFRRS
jgi:hypothetical protein